MEARGLRHPMVRTSLRGSPLRPADGFFLGAVLLLLILLVIFGRSGGFDLLGVLSVQGVGDSKTAGGERS